jgi:GDP-L-fucose synthase
MENYQDGEIINVGVGQDMQIMELARHVAAVTGFGGRIGLDPSYPDGTPRKLLDVSRITALGWQARTPLQKALDSKIKFMERDAAQKLLDSLPAGGK